MINDCVSVSVLDEVGRVFDRFSFTPENSKPVVEEAFEVYKMRRLTGACDASYSLCHLMVVNDTTYRRIFPGPRSSTWEVVNA
jgi:hypothetical protein